MNPMTTSALMMLGGASVQAVAAIPELIRLSKRIAEVKHKIQSGVVLSPNEEQQYQEMNMKASEMGNQITSQIQRMEAVNETGNPTAAYDAGADAVAKTSYDVGKARQADIAETTGSLRAEEEALKYAGAQVVSGAAGAVAKDASTLAGALAQQGAEEAQLQKMQTMLQAGQVEGMVAKGVDWDAKFDILKRMGWGDAAARLWLKNKNITPNATDDDFELDALSLYDLPAQ